ncbi:hypothetical protein L7F22_029576 [Adiantum nelumboides]|nr:hypothetical protein [Adiantum nelumboides]
MWSLSLSLLAGFLSQQGKDNPRLRWSGGCCRSSGSSYLSSSDKARPAVVCPRKVVVGAAGVVGSEVIFCWSPSARMAGLCSRNRGDPCEPSRMRKVSGTENPAG